MIAVKLAAPHDENGNPQRLWILLNDVGNTIFVYDESYDGYQGFSLAVAKKFGSDQLMYEGPTIMVSETVYKGWLKHGRENVNG